eukprot:CAMPEP_0114565278 /NCGR_PEP_ID=MMETSP0114-20121206/14218_1 /TAXON_ID=31324 /ORGANISM="Goniomonas sp, Strain m" /LENGTH=319 /DNA_ID=CAMNT_0001751501 /DNA_START=111 /DNA_END=1067 /DNA_ORIENTATION=-
MKQSIFSICQILAREPGGVEAAVDEAKGEEAMLRDVTLRNPALPPRQTTDRVLMVAPTSFYQNLQTKDDNYFMQNIHWTKQKIQTEALKEYSCLVDGLNKAGVRVLLVDHRPYHGIPDAVFPNNWFSTHPETECDGKSTLILYPMKAPNRRKERRPDIVGLIESQYARVLSLTDYEQFDKFLEGTGVLVLDRVHKIAYVALSERAHQHVAREWCRKMGYNSVITFSATDPDGRPIYHTNVMMCVGTSVAIVCTEAIASQEERDKVVTSLQGTGHTVVAISRKQLYSFCGNCIELSGSHGKRIMTMSSAAYSGFTPGQRE